LEKNESRSILFATTIPCPKVGLNFAPSVDTYPLLIIVGKKQLRCFFVHQ
jgi:hypothetical protein